MKHKISMIIVMLLLFRVPVFVISDGDDIIFIRIPIIHIPIETTQLHSVSLTPIKDCYYVTPYYIQQHAVIYSDQGGAGMPNQNEVILDKKFYSNVFIESKSMFLLMDDDNQFIVSNEYIDYQDTKIHFIRMKVSRLFLLEYLYKVGSL